MDTILFNSFDSNIEESFRFLLSKYLPVFIKQGLNSSESMILISNLSKIIFLPHENLLLFLQKMIENISNIEKYEEFFLLLLEKINKTSENQYEKIKNDNKAVNLTVFNNIDNVPLHSWNYTDKNIYINTSKYKIKAYNSFKKRSFRIVCTCKDYCDYDCVCVKFNSFHLIDHPPYTVISSDTKLINPLKIKKNSHIFECSDACSCDKSLCGNSLLGWKNLKRLKTSDFIIKRYKKFYKDSETPIYMWGLMSNTEIKKNSFVMEYTGEIITKEMADYRGDLYDKSGNNYLFDLNMSIEFKIDEGRNSFFLIDNFVKKKSKKEKKSLIRNFPLCIDAYNYGNLTRFINHSCKPNLKSVSIHVENKEILMPRIIYYSIQNIEKGEELTIDYNCVDVNGKQDLKCACGEIECKGFMYKSQNI